MAAEELVDRGYVVVRMGSLVTQSMGANDPRIIDYAVNGHHSEFMDIYLGSKCAFCVGTGTGWDLVPSILFRRPTLYTNLVPLGYVPSYSDKFMFTTKRHIAAGQGRELTLSEIFSRGVGFCLETSGYTSQGVDLIESTPEEIRDAVMEMIERLEGTWQSQEDDEELQRRFWSIFPAKTVDAYQGRPLHGEIRARFGTVYLRKNRGWLQ
jgi:putative glycosyltransferase (TIGR04372 family)